MSKLSEYLERHGGKVGHEANQLADVLAPTLKGLAGALVHDAALEVADKHLPKVPPEAKHAFIAELLRRLGLG